MTFFCDAFLLLIYVDDDDMEIGYPNLDEFVAKTQKEDDSDYEYTSQSESEDEGACITPFWRNGRFYLRFSFYQQISSKEILLRSTQKTDLCKIENKICHTNGDFEDHFLDYFLVALL